MHSHVTATTRMALPLYLCNPFLRASLVTGKFKAIIAQPKYSDLSEWVAMNLVDFYTNVNLFLEVLSDSCTASLCPTMSAGPNFSYPWIGKNGRNTNLPAPTHMDYIMSWIQNSMNDQSLFPTRLGSEFAPNFASTAKSVYRQLLHVFAHVYHAHFTSLLHFHAEGHFNSLFAHFLAFGQEFSLLEAKDLQTDRGQNLGIGDLAQKWRESGTLSGP